MGFQRFLARQFARPSGWVGRFLIAPWLDRIGRATNDLAFARLELGSDDDVLEVGFGGGALLGRIRAATSGAVYGIDPSEAAVARARSRLGGKVSIHRADVEAIPLPDASVDKAVSVDNLYFWSDPAAALAELARVLRPGGRLAIAFEPPEELRKWRGHRHGFRLYEVEEVKALLAAAGFLDVGESWGTGRRPDRFCCLTATRGTAEA